MNKNDCFCLGYISKISGNFGDITFVLDVDDPDQYKTMKNVFIEINNSLVPFFIKKIQIKEKNATVSIEGIDTVKKAFELIKSQLFLPLTFLPALKGKKFYLHEIIGFTVKDKNYGEVGIIKNVLNYPQQIIFQIFKNEKEILIPAIDEFILLVNRDKKIIEVSVPEGLIDLYLSE